MHVNIQFSQLVAMPKAVFTRETEGFTLYLFRGQNYTTQLTPLIAVEKVPAAKRGEGKRQLHLQLRTSQLFPASLIVDVCMPVGFLAYTTDPC